MASSESRGRWTQDLRWHVGLWVFTVLLVVGSACAAWALHALQTRGTQAARADTQAMGQSVAQTLAQQLDRAVRLGIPLDELPGLAPYLQAARKGQPALVTIAVQGPDGRTLAAAGTVPPAADDSKPIDSISLPVGRTDPAAGTVVVHTDSSAALRGSLAQAGAWAALAVVLAAALAALVAGLGPAAQLERQRLAVRARLGLAAAADVATAATSAAAAHGPLATLQALAMGDAEQQAARQSLADYAQELLAVDFDGQLRDSITRLQQGVGISGEHG